MIAAGHIGANASSRLHRGEGHHRNLKISCAKKNSIIHTAVSPFQNSFGSVLRAKCSSKSRLLTSAPTVVATNSVAPHSRANAGHRGSFVGQL